ncbi:hypothetical protein QTP86_014400, partial [Hemibagrus guttatus]
MMGRKAAASEDDSGIQSPDCRPDDNDNSVSVYLDANEEGWHDQDNVTTIQNQNHESDNVFSDAAVDEEQGRRGSGDSSATEAQLFTSENGDGEDEDEDSFLSLRSADVVMRKQSDPEKAQMHRQDCVCPVIERHQEAFQDSVHHPNEEGHMCSSTTRPSVAPANKVHQEAFQDSVDPPSRAGQMSSSAMRPNVGLVSELHQETFQNSVDHCNEEGHMCSSTTRPSVAPVNKVHQKAFQDSLGPPNEASQMSSSAMRPSVGLVSKLQQETFQDSVDHPNEEGHTCSSITRPSVAPVNKVHQEAFQDSVDPPNEAGQMSSSAMRPGVELESELHQEASQVCYNSMTQRSTKMTDVDLKSELHYKAHQETVELQKEQEQMQFSNRSLDVDSVGQEALQESMEFHNEENQIQTSTKRLNVDLVSEIHQEDVQTNIDLSTEKSPSQPTAELINQTISLSVPQAAHPSTLIQNIKDPKCFPKRNLSQNSSDPLDLSHTTDPPKIKSTKVELKRFSGPNLKDIKPKVISRATSTPRPVNTDHSAVGSEKKSLTRSRAANRKEQNDDGVKNRSSSTQARTSTPLTISDSDSKSSCIPMVKKQPPDLPGSKVLTNGSHVQTASSKAIETLRAERDSHKDDTRDGDDDQTVSSDLRPTGVVTRVPSRGCVSAGVRSDPLSSVPKMKMIDSNTTMSGSSPSWKPPLKSASSKLPIKSGGLPTSLSSSSVGSTASENKDDNDDDDDDEVDDDGYGGDDGDGYDKDDDDDDEDDDGYGDDDGDDDDDDEDVGDDDDDLYSGVAQVMKSEETCGRTSQGKSASTKPAAGIRSRTNTPVKPNTAGQKATAHVIQTKSTQNALQRGGSVRPSRNSASAMLWSSRLPLSNFHVKLTAKGLFRNIQLPAACNSHAVVFHSVWAASVEECCVAVGNVVGHENIVSASRMNSAIVVFLNDVEKVRNLTQNGIVGNNEMILVSPLSSPDKKVMLCNVPPFISDEEIGKELSRYGRMVSPIKKIPLGCKSPLVRHLVSFRRMVFMVFKEGDGELNAVFKFTVDGFDYNIFVSSDTDIKCFKCGQTGHLARACPERQSDPGVSERPSEWSGAQVVEDSFLMDLPKLSERAARELDRELSLEELHEALQRMENGRASGIDGLPAEFYKAFWAVIGQDVLDVLRDSIRRGELPLSCRRAVLTLLPKKGDLTHLKNWRPVSLLCTDCKLLSKALASRLTKVMERLIHQDQTYCVPDRSIFDNVYLVRDILDVSRLLGLKTGLIFLDQEKAFDRVEHEYLWKVLETFGFNPGFIGMIRVLCCEIESVLKVNGGLCAPFKVLRSIRQGCALSEHVKGRLSRWKRLVPRMYDRGRTLVINNLAVSSLWHKLACVDPLPNLLTSIQALLVDLWDGLHWIPQSVLHLPKEEGGQGLVQLASRAAAFRLQFLQRLLTGPKDLIWRPVAHGLLHKVGGLGLDRTLKRNKGCGTLHWLLDEPLIHGGHLDISGVTAPALSRALLSSRVMTLRELVNIAVTDLSRAGDLAAHLGKKDLFPSWTLLPNLDGSEGPLLKCWGVREMDFGSVSGKLLYRACVKVLNKKKLSGRVDTPWRSVLGFNGDIKPEWTH